jgi:hypothetical protein
MVCGGLSIAAPGNVRGGQDMALSTAGEKTAIFTQVSEYALTADISPSDF